MHSMATQRRRIPSLASLPTFISSRTAIPTISSVRRLPLPYEHNLIDMCAGLNAVGWAGTIYCTAITKHLVINIVETGDRILKAEVPSMKATKKFANLHLRDRNGSVPHDRIVSNFGEFVEGKGTD
jgi:hypothetical protein